MNSTSRGIRYSEILQYERLKKYSLNNDVRCFGVSILDIQLVWYAHSFGMYSFYWTKYFRLSFEKSGQHETDSQEWKLFPNSEIACQPDPNLTSSKNVEVNPIRTPYFAKKGKKEKEEEATWIAMKKLAPIRPDLNHGLD